MDLQWWARHGHGDVTLTVAQQAYRCARLGCGLIWQPETYPAGVPVHFYVGTDVKLATKCRKCGAGRSYAAEQAIAALERSETGDGNAGVNELGQRVRASARRAPIRDGWSKWCGRRSGPAGYACNKARAWTEASAAPAAVAALRAARVGGWASARSKMGRTAWPA